MLPVNRAYPTKTHYPALAVWGVVERSVFLWVGGGCSIRMHYDLDISTLNMSILHTKICRIGIFLLAKTDKRVSI